ncbi:ULP PROTEASE domain-containing protein [Citrus sinensis]|nr:ULP PROTEASE domain-containing protein [Citrus sinensis]
MGKRKRGDANNPIDIVSSTPEDPGHLSKHRTCWLHTVAFLHARKMKISKQKIRNFELTAPCFLGTFSCRRRSKRRVKCKNTSLIKGKNSSSVKCKDMITKRRKNKLDSGKFEHLLEFVMDIYKAEERPETKELISRIPLLVPKVPQQRNGEECGNFVLYFINLFVEGAPENFNLEDYPYFMEKNWFTAEDLDCFCERLNSSEN